MPKTFDLGLIGHFAYDYIFHDRSNSHNENQPRTLGGGVTYGSLAAANFDSSANIAIVSKIGNDFDPAHLTPFHKKKIDTSGVIVDKNAKTTTYELYYDGAVRRLRLKQKAPQITISDIPDFLFSAKSIHFTPIAGEISSKTLHQIAEHKLLQNTIIGLDVQGIIRDFDEDGLLISKDCNHVWKEFSPIFHLLGNRFILKASGDEALYLTNESSIPSATKKLGSLGIHVFTTMGAQGFLYYHPDSSHISLSAFHPNSCVDETGAGDCFMAVLLTELVKSTKSPESNLAKKHLMRCATLASAASSFLIEQPGPRGFSSRKEILHRVQQQFLHPVSF